MAITYTAFLTQVRNYTEVDSNVLSDTLLDQFIRQTELEVAGAVDYDDLRKYATANFVTGQRYLNRPGDELIIRSLQVFNTTNASGTRSFLEKRDTSFITEYNGSGATGLPKYYANWNENNFVVAPTPDNTYLCQLNYIIDPPHFTSTNTTYLDQITNNHYLYGVLTECFSYLKGPWICTISIKASMMRVYKLLLYNKWAEDVEENTMMECLELRFLHHHHKN
jgi:hypothetical protein